MQQGHAHERPRPVVLLFGPQNELVSSHTGKVESATEHRKHDEEEFVVRCRYVAGRVLREVRWFWQGLDARRE